MNKTIHTLTTSAITINLIVRERGRQVIQKMLRVEQEHDVIGVFCEARLWQHKRLQKSRVVSPVMGRSGCPCWEETGEGVSARIYVVFHI